SAIEFNLQEALPYPNPRNRAKHITANGHGMRKHSRKSFWFFFFRKRTVPDPTPKNKTTKNEPLIQ
ncbi:MAG: hypothetical protein J1E79_05910, partial [Rikenella sp.]|nr:hypothetical protein [Rikenella sp.]